MAAQLVVALLALASLCAAAPSEPDCTELVKPLVLDSHSPVSIGVSVFVLSLSRSVLMLNQQLTRPGL